MKCWKFALQMLKSPKLLYKCWRVIIIIIIIFTVFIGKLHMQLMGLEPMTKILLLLPSKFDWVGVPIINSITQKIIPISENFVAHGFFKKAHYYHQ